jgi:hypothetical protein
MTPLHEDPAPVALFGIGKTPGCAPSRVMRSYNEWTGDEITFICGYRGEREDRNGFGLGLVLFRLVAPPLQPGVVEPYPVRGAWFHSRLPLEGTESYSEFWAVTSGLWYPRYKTPIIASEPSVEWVSGAIYSMRGSVGTHISLQVPPQDSVVRTWG